MLASLRGPCKKKQFLSEALAFARLAVAISTWKPDLNRIGGRLQARSAAFTVEWVGKFCSVLCQEKMQTFLCALAGTEPPL